MEGLSMIRGVEIGDQRNYVEEMYGKYGYKLVRTEEKGDQLFYYYGRDYKHGYIEIVFENDRVVSIKEFPEVLKEAANEASRTAMRNYGRLGVTKAEIKDIIEDIIFYEEYGAPTPTDDGGIIQRYVMRLGRKEGRVTFWVKFDASGISVDRGIYTDPEDVELPELDDE